MNRLARVALFGALALGCKHDATPPPIPLVTEPPIAAPALLSAEGTLRDPDAFWGRIRTGAGAALADTPTTAAGLLLAVAGCDPALGALVSGAQPFQIAIGDTPDGTAFAIAMKIADFDGAQRALAGGDAAGYRTELAGTMIHLVPPPGDEPGATIAVTRGGFLVVASSVAVLDTLGAYAARTLPTKKAPVSSLELQMVPGALERTGSGAPALAARVARTVAATARGSLPAEVDAAALVGCFTPSIESALAAFGTLAEARVEANADGGELHATGTLVPKPGDSAARQRLSAMHPADAAPLLEAPADAMASFFWSDTLAVRTADVSAVGPCVSRALAPILGDGGEARLVDVLSSWARGRGDWESASIVARGSVAGLVGRAPVAGADEASRSFRGFVALSSQPSVQDAIRALLPARAGGVQSVAIPRLGNASVMMFAPTLLPSHFADAAPEVSSFAPPGVAWLVGAKEVSFGLGLSPEELIALAHPPTGLGADPLVASAVRAIGSDASLAAVLRPPSCCAGGRPGSGPLAVAWGRKANSGWLGLTVGDELVGMMARRAGRR